MMVDSDDVNIDLAADQYWSGVENLGADDTFILVGNDGAVLSSSGAEVAAIGTQADVDAGDGVDIGWGADTSDLAFSVNGAYLARYEGGNSEIIEWTTTDTNWSEASTPNDGRDVSSVTLTELPTDLNEELNWG